MIYDRLLFRRRGDLRLTTLSLRDCLPYLRCHCVVNGRGVTIGLRSCRMAVLRDFCDVAGIPIGNQGCQVAVRPRGD